MFNLSEQWKAAYDEYLHEKYQTVDKEFEETFKELEEATNNVLNTYNILEEYFNALGDVEALNEVLVDGTKNSETRDPENNEKKDVFTNYKNATINLLNVKSILSGDDSFTKVDYEAIPSAETVERISDMKFPKNVIFFIKQIINWIARVVIYFIEKIKNLIRVIFGEKPKELNKDYIKLKFERTKKLETMKGTQIIRNSKDDDVVKIYQLDNLKPDKLVMYSPLEGLKEDVDLVNEGAHGDVLNLFKKEEKEDPAKVPMFISIDVSKDLIALKQQVQHFIDLYDYAIGSNNEHLFKTEDLEIILKIFKSTIDDVKSGKANTYEIGSNMVEFSAIDSNRVKDNLVKTNINLENLKNAYMQTSAKIKDISNIIGHKQLLLLSQSGLISYKTVSSGTLQEIIRILEVIGPRVKESAKLERDLEKTQRKYNEISKQLQRMQQLLGSVSNLTYSTIYQKRITDLFNSARYMSQTVSLRLTAVGLYIKSLKEVRESLVLLARMNDEKK